MSASEKDTQMRVTKKQPGLTAAKFILTSFMLISGSCLAGPEIFRWVDDQGVVNFSEQPPANGKSERVDTRVDVSQGVQPNRESASDEAAAEQSSPAEHIREERAAARLEAAEKKAVTEAACTNNKAIIAQLEPFPRVMTRNEEGEMVRMDDNVRLEKLSAAQDYVAANCFK